MLAKSIALNCADLPMPYSRKVLRSDGCCTDKEANDHTKLARSRGFTSVETFRPIASMIGSFETCNTASAHAVLAKAWELHSSIMGMKREISKCTRGSYLNSSC